MDYLDNYFSYKNNDVIYGLTSELNVFFVLNLFKKEQKNIIVLTSSLYEANNYYNLFQTYTKEVLLFIIDDFLISNAISSPELKLTRLNTLDKLNSSNYIIICNLRAYLMFLPNKDENNNIKISINTQINRSEFIDKLINFGYVKESITTTTGDFSVRGMIIDIFLINEVHPIRIELDDNIIVGIKYFDETSQITINKIDTIIIKPISEIKTNISYSLYDYCNDSILINIDKPQIEATYKKLSEDVLNYNIQNNITEKTLFSLGEIKPKFEISLNNFRTNIKDTQIYSQPMQNFNNDLELLKNKVNIWHNEGKKVIFYLSNDNEIKKIKKILSDIKIIKQKINHGFIINDLVIIGEYDIDNIKRDYKYQNNLYGGKKILNYNELQKGDYVVHINHGIGIYNGIVSLTSGNITKDYIQIIYLDNDKIYVPVQKIENIYKYSDKDGIKPKLNRLNSSNWLKTRKYVESKVKDITKELLDLYKSRISIKVVPYKYFEEEEIFAKEFAYDLTKDQQRAINDITLDLSKDVPMDRLLCGDVGFGKTEIALRTMFKAILNNKQVIYLCPTTILSKQQYNVALKRFASWPVNIKLYNRFTTLKEEKNIIDGLEKGTIDIVFGTHKLLNNKLIYKRLGLLIIDEEQRFGVKHKELIKEMKKDINVLTLSATPIPRTLKMALSGLRSLSIIETPPNNRYPVQTYVLSEDELIIKDAIYKELSRNGQIFILYNNIADLENKTNHLKIILPEAKIRYAHGQMNKDELDYIMNDFIQHNFDILICTTIIENGIDIANANTLIVYNADYFGLSQLYQLRGRVGRSERVGYAYFLYNKNKVLNEIAIKRLQSIREFTSLGSGYKIAMRDLSIRGSGDIFGSSQAGFVDSVGVSLYTKMIEDELKKIKGEYVCEKDDDEKALINIDTHIEDSYVKDEDIKIEIHKLINEIDSYDKLIEVKDIIQDRFGKISNKIEDYMYEEWFEKIAKKLGIKKVLQTDRMVEIDLPKELSSKIKGDKLLYNALSISNNFKLSYRHEIISITLFYKNLPEHFVRYLVKLLNTLV
ncbi:MAG: transcription-repair coupling factor [Bacilli bacterium]